MHVHGVHVDAREPLHHPLEPPQHVVEVEHVARDRRERRPDLLAADLVAPAIDPIEQTLGEIGARAEELHLLAHAHRRHAARDRAIVAPRAAHDLVALELERAGVDGDFRGVAAEAIGQARRIPDGEIRLRPWPEVVQRVQDPEAGLRDERSAVVAHAGDRFRDPGGVAGEQIVVLRRPQEADDAQLDHEVVDDLLRLFLGQHARGEVAFEVDVEECRGPAERHGRAVLLLHAGQIAEVEPLHGLGRGARRTADVMAVAPGHQHQFLEGANLFGQLLAIADDGVGRRRRVELALLFLLPVDQPLDAIERDAPVVADDPPAAVGVGESRQDVRAAAPPHVRGIGVEHRVVVRLPVLREGLDDVRVGVVAVGAKRGLDQAEAAVRHDGALQRRVGLEADDDLAIAIDVAGRMGRDRAGDRRHVEHALAALVDEEILQLAPDAFRAAGRGREERFVARVSV